MIDVMCVLWGDKYSPEYVYKLKHMVEKNLSLEHRFTCITDQHLPGIVTMPPICAYPGWWQKLQVFSPGFTSGPSILMDIDVVVVGELDSVVEKYEKYSISAPKDWSQGGIAAAFVMWHPSVQTEGIWDRFSPDVMNRMHGDQNWMTEVCEDWWTEIESPIVCSYKWHVRRGSKTTRFGEQIDGTGLPPNGSRVICFHGKPDYPDVRDAWIEEALS